MDGSGPGWNRGESSPAEKVYIPYILVIALCSCLLCVGKHDADHKGALQEFPEGDEEGRRREVAHSLTILTPVMTVLDPNNRASITIYIRLVDGMVVAARIFYLRRLTSSMRGDPRGAGPTLQVRFEANDSSNAP
jgi:hypothetical protein